MKCLNNECNREIPDDSNICTYCGFKAMASNMVPLNELKALIKICYLLSNIDDEYSLGEQGAIKMFADKLNVNLGSLNLKDNSESLQELCALIKSPEMKLALYEMVLYTAYSDGVLSKEEEEYINKVVNEIDLPLEDRKDIEKRCNNLENLHKLSVSINPELKVANLDGLLSKKIKKYSILSTFIGLIPVPLVADMLFLVPLQYKMVAELGELHKRNVARNDILRFFSLVGGGLAFRSLAGSMSKFVPGFGSVVSAGVAFAGTYAIGNVASQWYKNDMKLSKKELKQFLAKFKDIGVELYKKQKNDFDPEIKYVKKQMENIASAYKKGKITKEEYLERIKDIQMNSSV